MNRHLARGVSLLALAIVAAMTVAAAVALAPLFGSAETVALVVLFVVVVGGLSALGRRRRPRPETPYW